MLHKITLSLFTMISTSPPHLHFPWSSDSLAFNTMEYSLPVSVFLLPPWLFLLHLLCRLILLHMAGILKWGLLLPPTTFVSYNFWISLPSTELCSEPEPPRKQSTQVTPRYPKGTSSSTCPSCVPSGPASWTRCLPRGLCPKLGTAKLAHESHLPAYWGDVWYTRSLPLGFPIFRSVWGPEICI